MIFRLIMIMLILTADLAYATKHIVKVGDTRVTIQQIKHGKGKSFVHLHQNETTALRAAKRYIASQGGSVLTLRHRGGRNIVFHLRHVRYEFDPNRMFTDRGIKKTLRTYGRYSPRAHAEVKRLANKVTSLLPAGKIIAVHNNKDYSIKAYLPGQSLHRDARAYYLNHKRYFRDFYLVTRQGDYFRLKHLCYNAILQARGVTDDGSLSVYLARRDYVNVEAGYGHLRAQIDMLKVA